MRFGKGSRGIGLAVVVFVLFQGALAFGGALGSWSSDPNAVGPPFGLALSSNAPGTKLYGVLEISYYGVNDLFDAQHVLSVLRLRQGNTLHTFYSGDLGEKNIADPVAIQNLLTGTFKPPVIDAFFPTYSSCLDRQIVKTKNVTELSGQSYCLVPLDPQGNCAFYDRFVVMDVEVAVDTVSCTK